MKELELTPEELREIKHMDIEEDEEESENENQNVEQGSNLVEEFNVNNSPSREKLQNLKNKIKEHQKEIDIKGERLINENENNQNVKSQMDDILIEVKILFYYKIRHNLKLYVYPLH